MLGWITSLDLSKSYFVTFDMTFLLRVFIAESMLEVQEVDLGEFTAFVALFGHSYDNLNFFDTFERFCATFATI